MQTNLLALIEEAKKDIRNIENITAQVTVNTTNVIGGSVTVLKCGSLVSVTLLGVRFNANGNGKQLITGLPKAKEQSGGIATGADGSSCGTLNTSGNAFYILKNGTTLFGHVTQNTMNHWITVYYLTED